MAEEEIPAAPTEAEPEPEAAATQEDVEVDGMDTELWESFGWQQRPGTLVRLQVSNLDSLFTKIGTQLQFQSRQIKNLKQLVERSQEAADQAKDDAQQTREQANSRLEALEQALAKQKALCEERGNTGGDGEPGSGASEKELGDLRRRLAAMEQRFQTRIITQRNSNIDAELSHAQDLNDDLRTKLESTNESLSEWKEACASDGLNQPGEGEDKTEEGEGEGGSSQGMDAERRLLLLLARWKALQSQVAPQARDLETCRALHGDSSNRLAFMTRDLINEAAYDTKEDEVPQGGEDDDDDGPPPPSNDAQRLRARRNSIMESVKEQRGSSSALGEEVGKVVKEINDASNALLLQLSQAIQDNNALQRSNARSDTANAMTEMEKVVDDKNNETMQTVEEALNQLRAQMATRSGDEPPAPMPMLQNNSYATKKELESLTRDTERIEELSMANKDGIAALQSSVNKVNETLEPIPQEVQEAALKANDLQDKTKHLQQQIDNLQDILAQPTPAGTDAPPDAALRKINLRIAKHADHIQELFDQLQALPEPVQQNDSVDADALRAKMEEQANRLAEMLQRQATAEKELHKQLRTKADIADVQDFKSVVSRKADEAWASGKLNEKVDHSELEKAMEGYMSELDSRLDMVCKAVRNERQDDVNELRKRFRAMMRDAIAKALEAHGGSDGIGNAKTNFGRTKISFCASCDRPVKEIVGTPVPMAIHQRLPAPHNVQDDYTYRGGGFRVSNKSRTGGGHGLDGWESPPRSPSTRPRSANYTSHSKHRTRSTDRSSSRGEHRPHYGAMAASPSAASPSPQSATQPVGRVPPTGSNSYPNSHRALSATQPVTRGGAGAGAGAGQGNVASYYYDSSYGNGQVTGGSAGDNAPGTPYSSISRRQSERSLGSTDATRGGPGGLAASPHHVAHVGDLLNATGR